MYRSGSPSDTGFPVRDDMCTDSVGPPQPHGKSRPLQRRMFVERDRVNLSALDIIVRRPHYDTIVHRADIGRGRGRGRRLLRRSRGWRGGLLVIGRSVGSSGGSDGGFGDLGYSYAPMSQLPYCGGRCRVDRRREQYIGSAASIAGLPHLQRVMRRDCRLSRLRILGSAISSEACASATEDCLRLSSF